MLGPRRALGHDVRVPAAARSSLDETPWRMRSLRTTLLERPAAGPDRSTALARTCEAAPARVGSEVTRRMRGLGPMCVLTQSLCLTTPLQTLEDSFSAVSKANFATKYSLE